MEITNKRVNKEARVQQELALRQHRSGLSMYECATGRCAHFSCIKIRLEREEEEREKPEPTSEEEVKSHAY